MGMEDTTITEDNFVYEPFSGGKPSPSPDYPQEVEVAKGNNLLDKNSGQMTAHKLPTTLKAGTYTLSCNNTNASIGFRLSKTTDTSSNSVVATGLYVQNNRQYLTLTTTFEANYINVSGTKSLDDIKLEKGSVATEYEPYNSIVSKANGKNLLPNNLKAQTINGLTITKNSDDSITLNGTTTNNTVLTIAEFDNFELLGNYNFYLFGKNEKINLQGNENNETVSYITFGKNNEAILKEYTELTKLNNVFSYIKANTTFDNETFKYMITKGTIATEYEPYHLSDPY